MGYYNLVIPFESVWVILNTLGESGHIQFEDANVKNPGGRPKTDYLKRCDEMENKLKYIETEMIKFKLQVRKCPNVTGYL